ncbi:DEAD/DEAH box helicase [Desulfobacterales bacterium HSG16]|nr:DEAD/DEAH box helicase [Desulfobacterales bacterium HSG16]
MNQTKYQKLDVVVMPDRTLHLESSDVDIPPDEGALYLQEEIMKRYNSGGNDWLLFVGFCQKDIPLSPSLDFWRNFTGTYTQRLSLTPDLEILRHRVIIPLEKDEIPEFLEMAPMMAGAEYLSAELLTSVWERLNKAFFNFADVFDGTIEELIQSYRPDAHLAGRVYFHLVENKAGELPFAFLATYSTRLDSQGKSKHLPLGHAIEEYGADSKKLLKLLATVHRAANKSDTIAVLLKSGELFHPLAWTIEESFVFLKEVAIYEESGILCRIPDWWKARSAGPRISVTVGSARPSLVGMNAVLTFNPRLFLGDTEISEAEVRELLKASRGLAFIKNKWVAADPEKLKQTLEVYEQAKELMDQEGFTLKEAMNLHLNPEKFLAGSADKADVSIENGKWLESVMAKLLNPAKISSKKPGKGFKAELRPYQKKGIDWLWFLHTLRFGACLADDMGLGKTVQLLGFLNALKSSKAKASKKASLLIIPASLIANWMSEIKKFSPSLKYYAAHPDVHRPKGVKAKSRKELDAIDLVITTYALVQKYEWVQDYSWQYVILDEAQAIKNPGTKQTRASKKLKAQNRIIMTGTPIENRFTDLWSLFDFLNPGLLGTSREFGKFMKKISTDSSGYSRLRKIISPYILRRLKTDKNVISDLPDKVEMKTYATLSKKQVILYKKLVDDIEESIDEFDGIQRKGLILASLMKFKQICNHTDQFLGTGSFTEKNSGKFARLREICETIYEKREKVLIFTQFKEMTEPISSFLAGIFKTDGLILHGSVPVGKRKKLIEKFQSREYVPFMVLSLKAGGVGLNLTEANHVIHFDRWWNPAVENQATDRAFRIGQKKNVVVHKFLTKGTVEEKIDLMLEEKSRMSNEVVVATGEKWITEMESKDLMDMFKLRL